MSVLVTGGAGFIGSHLCEKLLEEGREVVALDNLSTGSLQNMVSFANNPKFKFIKGDINDRELMADVVADCELVIHLAAAVGVQLIADKPVNTIETNIGGTQVVLDVVNRFKRKILLASTSEIYGKSEAVPFGEDDDIVLGSTSLSRWSYACSKAVDEFLALAFHQEYGLPVIITRFFNTIGPRQTGRYGMVVPRFVRSALKNEPLAIFGTGQQKRCFCYVKDVVEAVAALVESDKAVGKVFNIGSTEEISIEQLADKIIRITGSKSQKRFVDYETAYGRPIGDMARRVPSIEKIKNAIGWQPTTGLDDTLRIIVDSFRSNPQEG